MEHDRPDRLDLQIIRQLRQDGRRPTKEIAGALGVAEATVTTRIRALNEAGVMRVMAQRNVSMLREKLPCFINVWVRGRNIDEVAADLGRFERVATVHLCVGSPEIHVTAFVEDSTHILGLLQNEIGRVEGVDRLEVSLSLETRTYRSDYAALDIGPMDGGLMDDQLDDRIVQQLQIDGRVSNREIARVLDIPASTVRERVNRMLNANAIRIGAVCDPRKLGLTVGAFGYLQVAAAHIGDALEHLARLDDLGIVSSISGRYNIYVLVGARDFTHLVDVVKSKLEATPGLIELSIRMICDTKKHRANLINIISA